MVKRKIAALSILILTIGTGFVFAGGKREKGNGLVTTEEHIVPAFERVHSSTNADVRIHRAGEPRVVVSIDSNLHEYIEIRYDSGQKAVEILTPGEEEDFPRFTVDVYSPVLKGIGLAGTASIECVDPVSAGTFYADMTGSGSVTLRGNAEHLEVNLVGDCAFDGKEFKSADVAANIVGDGKMTVWTDTMKVSVVGNAEVNYRGDPVLDIAGAGNGRFVRIGD